MCHSWIQCEVGYGVIFDIFYICCWTYIVLQSVLLGDSSGSDHAT